MAVVIKRYQNRKLYNTQSKTYITLEKVEALIKDGQEIRAIDNQTGNDITSLILSEVIFESEKNKSGFLPLKLLLSLVQSGGNRIDIIRRNIFSALNLFHHYDVEIERRINTLIDNGEITQEEGSQLLVKLLNASQPFLESSGNVEGIIYQYLRTRQIPTGNEIKGLIQKIDQLSKRVDELDLNH